MKSVIASVICAGDDGMLLRSVEKCSILPVLMLDAHLFHRIITIFVSAL